jgi:hypothetical protein
MGIFSTLQSFVGSSADHYTKGYGYAQNATEHAQSSVAAVKSAFGEFSLKNSLYGAVFAYGSFEHIAGKVIAANSATHFANYFVSNTELSIAAQVTQYAAQTLVADPVSSMLVLMGGSILAANPEATFNAIKKVGEAAYEFTGATLNTVAAAGEFGLGVVSDTLEIAGHAEDYASKVIDSYDDPLSAVQHLVGDVYNSFSDIVEA